MPLLLLALRFFAIAAALAATAWAAGDRLLPRGPDGPRGLERAAVALVLGLAALAQVGYLLGLAGALAPLPLAGVAIAVHFVGRRRWREVAAAATARARRRPHGATLAAIAVAALAATPVVLVALYPPLGFDETMYHLPYAQSFAATGTIGFLPHLRFPVFPQLAEVLAAALLLFADDVATHAVGVVALAGCVLVSLAWARRAAGAVAGALAAAFVAGTPLAVYLATSGYVEPLLALFGSAGLFAAERQCDEAARPGHGAGPAMLVVAGFLAGSAAATKYVGILFPAAALALLVRRAPWRRLAADAARCTAGAAAAMLPTWTHLLVTTGNPLFPFYSRIFGVSPWSADAMVMPSPLAHPAAWARLPWSLAWDRGAVGNLPPFHPALPLAALVLAAAALRPGRHRVWLAVVAGMSLLIPLQAHYLTVLLPLAAVALGVGVARLAPAVAEPGASARRIALIAFLLLPGPAYAAWRLARLGPPPTTRAARAALLARQLPLYPAIAFLDRTAPAATVYAIDAQRMIAYYRGTLLGDENGPASYARVLRDVADPAALHRALRDAGATYFVVPRGTAVPATGDDRFFLPVYVDDRATVYRLAGEAPLAGDAAPSAAALSRAAPRSR